MFKVRVIPCLDVKDGRVVKGVNFVDLRDAGDPVEAAIAYDAAGADELTFLDITASHENRGIILDVVRRTAEACFMPLTVGGGVRTVEDIRRLLASGAAHELGTPLASLSVPAWAVEPATRMGADHRRIEGLIAPGTFNVNPSGAPQTILETMISASTQQYVKSGLLDTATAMNMSPYNVLVVASLVQREAKPQDFAKVARVIYNRLAEHRTLEFDSTVNYPLDRREVATTDTDRAQQTPWNTYVSDGLPATPICSPGADALKAAEHPEDGDWLYFVTIDAQGTTLFTRDYQQHLANIELAKRNGVLDSAR